jgi:hypothetical protein
MLLASFLANDAAASFDERRLPPAAKRGQVPERAALGPSKKTLLWVVKPFYKLGVKTAGKTIISHSK